MIFPGDPKYVAETKKIKSSTRESKISIGELPLLPELITEDRKEGFRQVFFNIEEADILPEYKDYKLKYVIYNDRIVDQQIKFVFETKGGRLRHFSLSSLMTQLKIEKDFFPLFLCHGYSFFIGLPVDDFCIACSRNC
jgi:hypothetical protein